MIEIIKENCKVGDCITLHTKQTAFKRCRIKSFNENVIILENNEGKVIAGVKDESIESFELLEKYDSVKTSEPIPFNVVDNENLQIENKLNADLTLKEYKAGEKIPLEILEKRTEKKTKAFSKNFVGMKFNSLSELNQLILPEIETENKLFVAANGTIIKFLGDRNFGFIRDKFGVEVWFSFRDVIDSFLLQSLRGTNYKANIPVLFSHFKNNKGDAALLIHKPKTVEQLSNLAKFFFEKENMPDTALQLIDQILESYPENYQAVSLKSEIESKRYKSIYPKSAFRQTDLNYQKAVRFKNNDKNYSEALKYYLIAFEKNERRESCIKDIGMLYVSMGESEKAIEFIKKYESELPDNISTYYYLENIFQSAKDFVKVLENVDILLKENSVINDKRKHSFYLSKKGFALIQLNELEEAKRYLEKAVLLRRENTYASALLEALEEPDNSELSQAIADAEFDSFGGGLSKFVKDTLESYNEYFGVPPKVIDSGDFKTETLHAIRRLIDTAGRARPRERANYLLTEAKLMMILEPEKDRSFRSILARYCNAMALNHISENSSMDVIRNYYLEAFNLEEKYSLTAPQVALYLISYKSTYGELLVSKTPSIEEALNYVFEGDSRENIWEGILSMFLWNRSISAQITEKLFEKKSLKDKSIAFLNNVGLSTTINSSIDDYSNIWNQAREKRQRDQRRWLASIKAIHSNENLETLTNQLLDSLNEAKKNWITPLDTSRLKIIASDIFEVLSQYLRESGYRDKERTFNFAKAQINQLITEIKEKPTKFSYEGFIPLLEKIDLLLEKSFKTVESASTPKVLISILGSNVVVANDNIVPFQIRVYNSKDSSPIRDISVFVLDDSEITFLPKSNVYPDSVDGGKDHIFQLYVQISEKTIKDKAATLNVKCEYKTRNQEETVAIQDQLSLSLYSEDEFEIIENHYAQVADGGPVENKKMFYGREEFIKNRIAALLKAESKQIIIYGQKRSGKSSVLFHLKKGLEETNKTFCVSFSLGLIVKDLNEFTFYHKILSTIDRELRFKKANKEIVPEFICPTLDEFTSKNSSNPANGFIETIEDFKIACSDLDDWKDRRMIVMIDEFTYLYSSIKKNRTSETIMKQWKAITQNDYAKFSVVLVGQDIVASFMKEKYAENAFGVIEPIRLTYLKEEDARKLIEEPILDKNGESRFLGAAVETIIDYTSRNPYYIQIFCARLVDEMNRNKSIRVTEANVTDVAKTFIEGSQALEGKNFDNLIRSGEEDDDYLEFADESIIKILRQIAIGSKNIGICSRDNISLNDNELEEKILNHLIDREVLERKQGDNFKIQVKLFQEWLLRH